MRIAAIDIGTNSIHCTVFEVLVGGRRKVLDDERAHTRLGRGTPETGRLSDSAMQDSIVALSRMLQFAETYEVSRVRAVATAAVREASNGKEFVARIGEELGLDVEVVSEEEEGRLVFLSAADSFGIEGRWAVVDIGGGSVEIVHALSRQIEFVTSLRLGAVYLSEQFHHLDPMSSEDYEQLVTYVHRSIAGALGNERQPVFRLVGSGGTVSSVGGLIAAEREPGVSSLHGFEFTRAELVRILASLQGTTAAERAAMKGMPENRVDIIIEGAVVLEESMRALGANEVIVNVHGIREGMVIDAMRRERGTRTSPS